jgi:hypothetical protein
LLFHQKLVPNTSPIAYVALKVIRSFSGVSKFLVARILSGYGIVSYMIYLKFDLPHLTNMIAPLVMSHNRRPSAVEISCMNSPWSFLLRLTLLPEDACCRQFLEVIVPEDLVTSVVVLHIPGRNFTPIGPYHNLEYSPMHMPKPLSGHRCRPRDEVAGGEPEQTAG